MAVTTSINLHTVVFTLNVGYDKSQELSASRYYQTLQQTVLHPSLYVFFQLLLLSEVIWFISSSKAHELLDIFRARDYHELILQEVVRKGSTTRQEAYPPKSHPTPNKNKLIHTIHSNNFAASKIIHRRFNILHSDQDTK